MHAAASTGAAPSTTLVVNAVVDADEAITAPHVVHVVTGADVAPTATPVVNAAHLPSASFALPCPHSGSLTAATPTYTAADPARRLSCRGSTSTGSPTTATRTYPSALCDLPRTYRHHAAHIPLLRRAVSGIRRDRFKRVFQIAARLPLRATPGHPTGFRQRRLGADM